MIMSARDVLIKTSAIAAGIIPSEIIPLCNGKKVVTIETLQQPGSGESTKRFGGVGNNQGEVNVLVAMTAD